MIQHRRERSHPVGTARIVRLGLSAADIVETGRCLPRPALRPGAALLYPGPESRDLSGLRPDEAPTQLVVLDGTWHQARRLFLDNPWIQELPRVRLTPASPSRYRIRRQPAEHCVSTLESIVAALGIIEPDTAGLDGLLDVFDTMVEEQRAFMISSATAPRPRPRVFRPARAIPPALREAPERVVAVHAETAPCEPGPSCGPRQLVRWSALRPFDGAVFDRVVRPAGAPSAPGYLEHLGLSAEHMVAAVSLTEAAEAWREFRQDDDIVVAWHPAMLRILTWLDTGRQETAALRGLWANITHKRPGGLAALVDGLELAVEVPPIPGRAARRLGQTVAILRHLVRVAPYQVQK